MTAGLEGVFYVTGRNMKTCSSCKESKPHSAFYKHRSKIGGLKSNCKVCEANYKRKVGPDGLSNSQRSELKYAYGLTPEQVAVMRAEQGNACAICRNTERKLYVDHDHATGKIRSLLCNCCNSALGKLGDSARIATAAAEYLSKHGKP